ncbi:MAG: IS21-like element helper ATPase IstB [Candidatus Thiodiazotropha sp. (ex Lucinoma borealis)]|nr:IS21-like element helper ATPase IstB [Candidatus Thiodiazotropha sp. (ex Lucinoma borealis)]MCU7867414.1 IS21-like element helper ATPase IstB [Candidatus Thiodiazotropha sp. (ex Lucinoma borealis)]MCU7868250.1 IS21-like element helper ATPase IstB [Candidatus Thiodiazotropha sp. (ex Lucinoma borealis)]
MLEQTITQLRELKLTGMAHALVSQTEQPGTYEELPFEQRLQLLTDAEQQSRNQRKQQRLLKAAKLKIAANPKSIDYQHPRGLKQPLVASLLQCDWINKHQNLLLTGPCGSGKTYIACALAHAACMKGYRSKYYRLSRLLLELTQTKADGSYSKALQTLAKLDLLILDDWGLEPLKAAQRNDLMEIMDDRNSSSSTVIISQLPTDQWYQSIGDNTLADAILDRLMHNAHRIKLKGESMRKLQSEID